MNKDTTLLHKQGHDHNFYYNVQNAGLLIMESKLESLSLLLKPLKHLDIHQEFVAP